ncbi:MAG: hypothetical protein AAB661_01805 [Patescibacteria group bacterium]
MDEEEMRKMAEEMSKIPGMPKPIFIKVEFDRDLQKITGKKEIPMVVSQGATFAYVLQNIFIEYPGIEKKYPPGELGFTIDGTPPKTYTPIFDGDVIRLSVRAY